MFEDVFVIVYVAAPANSATVCGGANSDAYGPFNVTLDADNKVTAIDPSSVDLTDRTIGIINSGQTSVCLQVTANFNATVRIEEFTFTLSKAQVAAIANSNSGNFESDGSGLFGTAPGEFDGLDGF